MSFKSREKKRVYKLAVEKSRREHQETMAGRWYITVVSRRACCNSCASMLKEGGDCVYRYCPKEIVCLNCATSRELAYRPSAKWEKRKGGRGEIRSAA